MFAILSAVVEQERTRTRERISEAKEQMHDENRCQGGKAPFGYRANSDGELVEDEFQQKCLKFIKVLERKA